jgi:low affinity Fe/Cu permease
MSRRPKKRERKESSQKRVIEKAAEKSNRTTKDAIEKLEEQLKSEQRARHAVLMEEEVKATEEREEGKTLLKQAIDRQHHMHKHSAQSHTTAQVHTIPSPSRQSLWFQHPGYELLDWPAWLS